MSKLAQAITRAKRERWFRWIRSEADGEIIVAIDDLEVELDDLAVSGLTPTTEFLAIPKISLYTGDASRHFPLSLGR